ncbi:MAG TPA: hypothetical protein VFJ17_02370 [Mycobacteriales bacterium]|jgi:hypothetical protein|nr:hypothetical protein [Mycobacteriales bacterium]
MTGAVLVRWGANIPGRETKGLEVFGKAIERFEQLAKQGRIHSHTEYIALTGSVGGFMLIQGEIEELQKILMEPENLALTTQASMIVTDFEQNLYAGGNDQAIQQLVGVELESLAALGYA